MTLAQATGGKKPLALAMGDWAFLVQATGGKEPLVCSKGSVRLSVTWCFFCDLQTAGKDHGSHLGGQR